jgi:hypothetical protein
VLARVGVTEGTVGIATHRALVEDLRRAALRSPEPERLRAIIERERTIVANAVTALRGVIGRYSWVVEGRGSYEWDDDRFREEFVRVGKELAEALAQLHVIARDLSDCPTTQAEVDAARSPEPAAEPRYTLDEVADVARQAHHAGTRGYNANVLTMFLDRLRSRGATTETGGTGDARELLCQVCNREYPVWFAPNELWNAVVRLSDGSDRWPFLCPTCFGMKAVEAGVGTTFVLRGVAE